MTAPLPFSDDPGKRLPEPIRLRPRRRQVDDDPSRYVIDDSGLVAAINAALILGQPLLLTGEAGAGKTTLASRVAWQLGLERPLKFETKSTTTAKDLFYTFDALGRFQAGKGESDPLRYLTYNALGLAILYSRPAEETARLFPPHQSHPGAARRSVVLIDEIDKAHRDFPNDLLNELDRMFFRIPEMDNQRIAADDEAWPVVLITSNSEKNLPDPFLRRCTYYHLQPPTRGTLTKILTGLLPELEGLGDCKLVDSGLSFYEAVRGHHLRKKPSTAELVAWMTVLLACGVPTDQALDKQQEVVSRSLGALAKTHEDLEEMDRFSRKHFHWATS